MKQLFSRILRTTVALSAAAAIAMPSMVSNAATMIASPQRQVNNSSYTVKLTYVEDGSNKIGDREVKKDATIATGVTYSLGADSNMKYDAELGWNTSKKIIRFSMPGLGQISETAGSLVILRFFASYKSFFLIDIRLLS